MILLHIIDDFVLQPICLSKLKQKSFWETYSAFANTVGGLVLLGVEENRKEKDVAKRFTFTGVKNPGKIISDLWNTINSNKVSHNILRDEDVDSIEVDGVTIVYVSVPQADWRDKPIYLNENPYKGTFRRNKSDDSRFKCRWK